MRLRLILWLLLVAAALLFVFQNVGVIEIRFLFWSVALSRSLLLFLVLIIGVAVGWLGHSVSQRRANRRAAAEPR